MASKTRSNKKGILHKHSAKRASSFFKPGADKWESYLFQIVGGTYLQYFHKGTTTKPHKQVYFSEIEKVELRGEESGKFTFLISFKNKGEIWKLAADSQEERVSWMEAIHPGSSQQLQQPGAGAKHLTHQPKAGKRGNNVSPNQRHSLPVYHHHTDHADHTDHTSVPHDHSVVPLERPPSYSPYPQPHEQVAMTTGNMEPRPSPPHGPRGDHSPGGYANSDFGFDNRNGRELLRRKSDKGIYQIPQDTPSSLTPPVESNRPHSRQAGGYESMKSLSVEEQETVTRNRISLELSSRESSFSPRESSIPAQFPLPPLEEPNGSSLYVNDQSSNLYVREPVNYINESVSTIHREMSDPPPEESEERSRRSSSQTLPARITSIDLHSNFLKQDSECGHVYQVLEASPTSSRSSLGSQPGSRYSQSGLPSENRMPFVEQQDEEENPVLLSEKYVREFKEMFAEALINSSQLKIGEKLGEGAFGLVYKGLYKQKDKTVVDVAIKTIRNCDSNTSLQSFLKESAIMKDFSHPHVLGLCGVCLDTEDSIPVIVLPFMANGDLRTYLRSLRQDYTVDEFPEGLDELKLLTICNQIAGGMDYLEKKHFIHRDLAARNCMMDNDFLVKIADFGMARDVHSNEYYRLSHKAKLPIKWMAPECFYDGKFDHKSDVWAFGVTCWEVYCLGRSPYPGVEIFDIPKFLDSGRRLEKPPLCSAEMFSIMASCWDKSSKERPSFSKVVKAIQAILQTCDYMNFTPLSPKPE